LVNAKDKSLPDTSVFMNFTKILPRPRYWEIIRGYPTKYATQYGRKKVRNKTFLNYHCWIL
jgi:hypothetical protein